MNQMIYPAALKPGDRIAIISPATTVKEEYIDGAMKLLEEEGFEVTVMPSAKGPASGSFASSEEARLTDLMDALTDPEVKCIFCARGGYGCVHLLPHIPAETVRSNPKWLVGFSDISALHALWQKAGVASIHGPMAKHLTTQDRDGVTSTLLSILKGSRRVYFEAEGSLYNRPGKAVGRLRGGNLAVLSGLASTPYDMFNIKNDEDVILFIEDISEAIYAVERMLIRLHLAGVLSRIKGLIVGRFTDYRPDRNYDTMEQMIDSLLTRYGIKDIPVAFNFNVGHVDFNLPLIEGDLVELRVYEDITELESID